MKKIFNILCIMTLAFGLVACSNTDIDADKTESSENGGGQIKKQETYENKNYVKYVDESDISGDVSSLGRGYDKYYDKYINYTAPNGKPIIIVAADKVTDEQVLKAYNILSFLLADTKDYNKTAVADAMANNNAVLNLPNGADGDGNTPDEALKGQPLYQMELPVAGSKWYIENDYEHRDASYEEIFHMVHDYGIGTTQNTGALPELSEKIKKGMETALPKQQKDWGEKGIWGLGSKDWLMELSQEGSLEQEYIVSGIDSYFGLWEAYTESDKGMWGFIFLKTGRRSKRKTP